MASLTDSSELNNCSKYSVRYYRIKVETSLRKFPEPQDGLGGIVAEGIERFGGSTIDFSVKKNEDTLFRDGPLRIKRKRIVPFASPVTYLVESRGIDIKDVANFRRLLTIFGVYNTLDSGMINVEKYAFSGRTPGWMGAAYIFACNCGLVPRINSANAFDTKRICLAHKSRAAIEKRSRLGPLKEEDTSHIEQYMSRLAKIPKGSLWAVWYGYAENTPEKASVNKIKIINPEKGRDY